MPIQYITSEDDPGKAYASGTMEMGHDLRVRQKPDGSTQVFVRQRGIYANPYDGLVKPRRLSTADPDYYVAGNIYNSIQNVRAALIQDWGGAGPGERWYGVCEVAPGRHVSAATLDFDFAENMGLSGVGPASDPVSPSFAPQGHAMTEITGPNNAFALRLLNSIGGTNHHGPLIERIGFRSGNGAGGGIYQKSTEYATYKHVSVFGYTSGHGWHFDGTTGDCNYNTMLDCRVGKCLYGVRAQGAASASLIHCKINGNNGGNDNILAGSRGLWTTDGHLDTSSQTYVQGFEKLIYQDDDFCSFHDGTALEDFTLYAIHIAGALGAGSNRGFSAYLQSVNNFLTNFREPANCASSRAFYLSHAGIGNVRIYCGHTFANNNPQYNNGGVMTDIPFRQQGYIGAIVSIVDWNPS